MSTERGPVSSETAPLAFQLHDEAFGDETDGSVKLPSYAAANLAVVMRWLKRGRKRGGGCALRRDTTTLGFATNNQFNMLTVDV